MATQKNYRVIGFSVPRDTAKQMDAIARKEQRTKSELFREMFRVWSIYRKREDQMWDEQIAAIINEVNAEKAAGRTPSTQELRAEIEALSGVLATSIKKQGYSIKQLKEMGYVTE